MKEGRKPEYSEKTPADELQKMSHTNLQPEDSSPKRHANPHNSIGGRLGKQTCQPLHHASPLARFASVPRCVSLHKLGVWLNGRKDPHAGAIRHRGSNVVFSDLWFKAWTAIGVNDGLAITLAKKANICPGSFNLHGGLTRGLRHWQTVHKTEKNKLTTQYIKYHWNLKRHGFTWDVSKPKHREAKWTGVGTDSSVVDRHQP